MRKIRFSTNLLGKRDYRVVKVKNEEACFAILDKNPKVLGHSLVISKTPFDDLTDSLSDVNENEKTLIFESAVELARRIEIVLGAEKVYIQKGIKKPADNTHEKRVFVVATEKNVPKSVFIRKRNRWKLVDEFSGYIIHKKIKQIRKEITVDGLIETLDS